MKKIITFLFCTAVFTSTFAQKNRHDGDDRNNSNNFYWNSNTKERDYQNDHDRDKSNFRIAQRNMQIQRISSQYDYQIQQISCDRSLSRRKRKLAVEALEYQKAEQINRIDSEYNSDVYSYNRNNDFRHNR